MGYSITKWDFKTDAFDRSAIPPGGETTGVTRAEARELEASVSNTDGFDFRPWLSEGTFTAL
jgi:hypothetical protein